VNEPPGESEPAEFQDNNVIFRERFRLVKHWPSADAPSWTLTVGDVVIEGLSTATLFDHRRLWRKVALATQLKIFFPTTSRAEHVTWLRPLLADCGR